MLHLGQAQLFLVKTSFLYLALWINVLFGLCISVWSTLNTTSIFLCEVSIVFFHNRKEMGEERERRLATRLTTMRLAMLSAETLALRNGKLLGKIISPCVISKWKFLKLSLVDLLEGVILRKKKENISQVTSPYFQSTHACSVSERSTL